MARGLGVALAILLLLLLLPAATVAAGPTLTVHGSPFDPNGNGKRESVGIEVSTAGPATVELRVHDFNGKRLKTITTGAAVDGSRTWSWRGRDAAGRKLSYGPYRIKAVITSKGRTYQRAAWVTRGKRLPYPRRPGAVTVALDPGHGGPAAGAVWKGWKEDNLNLDIGLRLEAMLRDAGIKVVMTRRTDRNVSPVGKDLNFDGRYTRVDELFARNDVANQARADIHLALHNNASSCHCVRGTEMYTHNGRSWAPEGRKLANALLREHLWHLNRLPGFTPRNRGVRYHDFKALKPYYPVAMPRPSLQPSVLGESLFLDWPSEYRRLTTRAGRTAIAAAYFDGIAHYLASRPYGLRYQVLEAPTQVAAGAEAAVKVRVTNTGQRSSASWKLVARVVGKKARYDGRPRHGDVIAKVAIPNGLAPGASTDITLRGIPMRATTGEWLLKPDVNLPAGDTLSKHGVVGPQLRVRTVAP
jgi:N-acetylmuramoyl-L-alanine amidase